MNTTRSPPGGPLSLLHHVRITSSLLRNVVLVLFHLIIAKYQNNSIGPLDGDGVGEEHSPMHRRNVPKMPLMITRTTSRRAKPSFLSSLA